MGAKQAFSMGLRPEPRPQYREECTSPRPVSTSEQEKSPRLVIMDLNKTVLYRRGRSSYETSQAIIRPFFRALMRYCLGSESKLEPESKTWTGQKSHGPYEVGIWSTATDFNVRVMVDRILPPSDPLCKRLIGIWDRTTLVPQQYTFQNVQATKDLEVPWAVLNLEDTSRLDATARSKQDLAPRDPDAKGLSLEQYTAASAAGPFGPGNTIMLDDTIEKAKLQPYNAIIPLEFDQKEAQAIQDLRQKTWSYRNLQKISLYPSSKEQPEAVSDAEQEKLLRQRAWDLVLRIDTTLLQVIGILDEALYVDHVGHWIHHDGTKGFPLPETHLLPNLPPTEKHWLHLRKQQGESSGSSGSTDPKFGPVDPLATALFERIESSEPSQNGKDQFYWIVRGVRACARRDIPLTLNMEVLQA